MILQNPKREVDEVDGADINSCGNDHTNFHEPTYNVHLLPA
jgi:hypothetical protein